VGVSPDPPATHARFRDKYSLDFTLLSDPDKAVSARWGAFGEKSMYGRKVQGMIRSTFVIDAGGVVRAVFSKVRVDGHADKVLAALAAL
jgi:peroxiredoxin Q/BCP